MTSRRTAIAVLATALALAGCSNPLGGNTPVCDEASTAVILSAQAIPGTAFVPCIHSLKTDWMYQELRAERGWAEFSLSSMGMGMPFLRVRLQPQCDTSKAARVASDEPGVPLLVDVAGHDDVQVVVVPDGAGLEVSQYAAGLRRDLAGVTLADRSVDVQVDLSAAPVSQRIATAHQSGATVLVVTVRDSEQGTVSAILPGGETELRGMARSEITRTLRKIIGPATYTGSWYYPFGNGCVSYHFDAHGSGVATLEADVKAALGLFDAEALRRQAREAGFDVR